MSHAPIPITRREDRETALAILYEADMNGDPIAEVAERNGVYDEDYAATIVHGVDRSIDTLDRVIDEVASDWTVRRMPGIDRAILRMGAFELTESLDVPITAVVSEAVALANQYSTERSAPFINGVLVALAERMRGDEAE